MKAVVIVVFLFISSTQATYKHKLTQSGKICIEEVKSHENTVRALISDDDVVPEGNELMEKIFECCFRGYIKDTSEVIVDDKLTTFVTEIVVNHVNVNRKLGRLLATDLVEQCKDIKGGNKGDAAVKVFNCLMKNLREYYTL